MEENKCELVEIVENPVSLTVTVYGKRLYVQLSQPLCCISLKKKDACIYDENDKCLRIDTMKKGQGEDVQDSFYNVEKETAEQVVAALMRFNTGLMDASNTKKDEPIFLPETWQRVAALCSLVYGDAKEGICKLLNFIYNALWVMFLMMVTLFVFLLLL